MDFNASPRASSAKLFSGDLVVMAWVFSSIRLLKLNKLLNRQISRKFCSNNIPIYCEKLTNRVLIEIKGEEGPNFLQGLITNDINHLVNGSKSAVQLPCVYSMMLNIQGRLLYDILIYKDNDPESQKLLLECDSRVKENLIKHLKMYKLRKKIDINVTDEEAWSVFSHDKIDRNLTEINRDREIILVKDPRTNSIGYRVLASCNTDIDKVLSLVKVEGKYKERLYQEGIGEGIDDLPSGNCFPLECNGDYLNGVSFHKGCYIGQELTSRIHHTGVVRKRLMPINLDSPQENVDLKSIDIENEAGKKIGKLRGLVNQNGIALMRIEETLAAKEIFWINNGLKVKISVKKPNWWPIEVSK